LYTVRKYAEETVTAHTLPIIESHIVNSIVNQNGMIQRELRLICELQADSNRLYKWITAHFPSANNEWVRRTANTVVHNIGDAVMVSDCARMTEYVIFTSRKLLRQCY
jgi:hypothetical protein